MWAAVQNQWIFPALVHTLNFVVDHNYVASVRAIHQKQAVEKVCSNNFVTQTNQQQQQTNQMYGDTFPSSANNFCCGYKNTCTHLIILRIQGFLLH